MKLQPELLLEYADTRTIICPGPELQKQIEKLKVDGFRVEAMIVDGATYTLTARTVTKRIGRNRLCFLQGWKP
jgi:hypothetical protein